MVEVYRDLGSADDRLRAAIVLGHSESDVVQRVLEGVRILVLLGNGFAAGVLAVPATVRRPADVEAICDWAFAGSGWGFVVTAAYR